MPDPKFAKPWHGVPRSQISWNPTVLEEVCIGCGTCVTGCSRLVYRFDFARKKPVVVDPLNCMVGCTTCANTCPANAVSFPSIESVLALEESALFRHAVEDDLVTRRDLLAATGTMPHPDRIISLAVRSLEHLTPDVLKVVLVPVTAGECFCEFMPGQYIELWQPDSTHLSRSYSIANAPHGDGAIELHVRRVEGGRFTAWAFDTMKVGDQLQARGPLGAFTMRSRAETPLLFVAGGTGVAPILALIEQQADFAAQRDVVLLWGIRHRTDFYAMDTIRKLVNRMPALRVRLVAALTDDTTITGERLSFEVGTLVEAMSRDITILADRDIYIAGPPAMLREIAHAMEAWAVDRRRIHIDSFGV